MRTIITQLRAKACVLVLAGGAAGLVSGPVLTQEAAQTKQHGQKTQIEEIMVSARRVEESLQEVPVSVGTLGVDALENRQIFSLSDMRNAIVGLTTYKSSTAGGNLVAIRGVTGIATPQPASESAVGYYIDGVYYPRNAGAGAGLVDLASVEVLRGPQGTLFGRNSTAGTINFITAKPSEEFEGSATLLYGNYDHRRLDLMLNVPITDDLIVRFAALADEEDGDIKNHSDSKGYTVAGFKDFAGKISDTMGHSDLKSYLLKVRYTGIENLTVDYKYDKIDLDQTPNLEQMLMPNANFAGTLLLQAPGRVPYGFDRVDEGSFDWAADAIIRNDGHLLELDYTINENLSVRNFTSYRTSDIDGITELDGGDWALFGQPFCASCSATVSRQNQLQQEDQLLGNFEETDFILGLYYFRERADFVNFYNSGIYPFPQSPTVYTPTTTQFTAAGLGDFLLGNNGEFINKSKAIYGHVDHRFTDTFDIAIGMRHTWDDRTTHDRRSWVNTEKDVQYKRLTYDIALNYHVAEDSLLYVKYSTGYVSGGIDSAYQFKPEDVREWEAGFKSEFLDSRLRLNGSVYKSWYTDRLSTAPNFSTGTNPAAPCNPSLISAGFTVPCPLGLFVYNLPGTSTVQGFEVEATAVPIEGWTLTANFGYFDEDASTGDWNRAPDATFAFSSSYDFPSFDNGSYFTLRIDGDWRNEYFGVGTNTKLAFSNTAAVTANVLAAAAAAGIPSGSATEYLAALQDAATSGDYWLFNARLSLLDIPMGYGNARGKIALWGRNLTDEDGVYSTTNYATGIHAGMERSRTYGIEVGVNF